MRAPSSPRTAKAPSIWTSSPPAPSCCTYGRRGRLTHRAEPPRTAVHNRAAATSVPSMLPEEAGFNDPTVGALYSQLTGVLAGFSFAALVLLVTRRLDSAADDKEMDQR
jgi:hypothetical protein